MNKYSLILAIVIALTACSEKQHNKRTTADTTFQANMKAEPKTEDKIIEYTFEIIDILLHERDAFTQGFLFHDGYLYEGTGLEGKSKLRKINPKTGEIIENINLDNQYFGEGIAVLGDKIYQLTWHNQKCFVYDRKTLKKLKEFDYMGEGWGLTNNDSLLILSDGSALIKFINPIDFSVISTKLITENGKPVYNINELELINGQLFANIWGSDFIIIADISTGKIVGKIDISALRPLVADSREAEVSNGIAYDKAKDVLYLTGKNWSKIFIVKIKPQQNN